MQALSSPLHAAQWLQERVRGNLHTDSRKLRAGDGFIAWPGAATDGRRFVANALQAGASACVVEAKDVQEFHFVDERVAIYQGLKAASGPIADQYYGHPSAKLDVLAVTGTNGKTSTAWWLSQALNSCGLIGTLGVGIPGDMTPTGLTTPDPVLLQAQLRIMVESGMSACAIEASSIGIEERRLDGTRIRVAVFTNLTQDHLDYHGDMEAYWQAKRALFDWEFLQAAVINLDDPKGAQLLLHCQARKLDAWGVSRLPSVGARLHTSAMRYTESGMQFLAHEGGQTEQVQVALMGDYNVSNLLGVLATLRVLGYTLQTACRALSGLTAVPGRLECIMQAGLPMVVIDYAHSPDALLKVLNALQPVAKARQGKLWCVFGCGGDRDATKRPLMAHAAEQTADVVVVTSDNPRSESSSSIMSQIVQGLQRPAQATLQADRALAISQSIAQAAPSDVVVIAGKGHEDYQEVAGVRHPFSDKQHALAALQRRRQSPAQLSMLERAP